MLVVACCRHRFHCWLASMAFEEAIEKLYCALLFLYFESQKVNSESVCVEMSMHRNRICRDSLSIKTMGQRQC